MELEKKFVCFVGNISMQGNMEDMWIWDLNWDGMFSVKEVYVTISNFEAIANSPLYDVTWTNLICSFRRN